MDDESYELIVEDRGGRFLVDEQSKTVRQFLTAKVEFAQKIIEVLLNMPECLGDGPLPEIRIDLINNTEVNAFVQPSDKPNAFFIGIHLGVFFRIHNILFEALRQEFGLLRFCTHNEYAMIEHGGQQVSRSISCPDDVEAMLSDFEQFQEVECDTYYRELTDDLVDHAIEFFVAHELAHILRNHFTVLVEHGIRQAFQMIDENEALQAFSNGCQVLPKQFERGVEADADMQAIFMGYRIFELLPSNSDAEFIDHVLDDAFFRLFAIGAVFLVMDDRLPLENQYSSHPPSYVRLMYIQSYIKAYHEFVSESGGEKLVDDLVTALLELENLAVLMGIDRGRWVRTDAPNKSGSYLEISQFIKTDRFVQEDLATTDISNLIDQASDVCFIDGAAELNGDSE